MKRIALKRIALASSILCLAAPALAADLPSRYREPIAPYYNPTPIFTWTGFYGGINGALGIGSFTQGGSQAFGTPLGGLGGLTAGYNYQSGQLLVGGEVDAAFGSISGNGYSGTGGHSSGVINGLGTARVRVGYVFNQALFYVTGGYAGTALNGKVSDFSASPNLILNQSHYLNGFAVGAGVEYAITTKISIKGEYLFTGFGSRTFFDGSRDATTSGANISLIRAGVNYHF